MSNKIIFMGTPDFAVFSLEKILQKGINVAAVVTAPDKAAGRGKKIKKSAVKKFAESKNIKILQPTNLKSDEFINELKRLKAELFVVVAFRMLPKTVWSLPGKGTINLHASLLPNYRGAAPINWALINGEKTSGVSTFFINEKIDCGAIIDKKEVQISEEMNAGELHDILAEKGADLLTETIDKIFTGNYKSDNQKNFKDLDLKPAPKIFKKDCEIDWDWDVKKIHNFIRGLSPYPGAWTKISDQSSSSKEIKIFKSEIIHGKHNNDNAEIISDNKNFLYISAEGGLINIIELQMEGKKRMNIYDFLRGNKPETYKIIK